jgi:hypothetical protein
LILRRFESGLFMRGWHLTPARWIFFATPVRADHEILAASGITIVFVTFVHAVRPLGVPFVEAWRAKHGRERYALEVSA